MPTPLTPRQDNCEERELSVSALCEQVSLRISSIDGAPVPARTPPTAWLLQDNDFGVSFCDQTVRVSVFYRTLQ